MQASIPVAEELLKHRKMMLGLARSLVGRDEAEDVVQDAYARALTHPPESDENLRGWMLRITRNLSLNSRRSRSRETGQERLTGLEEIGGSCEALDARFELILRVAEAVRSLEEPYRSVILLRHFEDKPHEEMAVILARPLATVRTQLRRGLEQLRSKMDRQCGGRGEWSLALIAWIDGQPPGAGGGPAAASGLKPLWVSAGLLAVTAGWLILRSESEPGFAEPGPAFASPESKNELAYGLEQEPARKSVPTSREFESRRAELSEPSDQRYLVGRVHGVPSGGRTQVRVAPAWRSYRIEVEPMTVEPDEHGEFRVGLDSLLTLTTVVAPEPDELEVFVDHPQCVLERIRVPLSAGESDQSGALRYEVEARLQRAAILTGVVRDEEGGPVEGAQVVAFAATDSGVPEQRSQAAATTDAEGGFVLRVAATGPYRVAVLKGTLRPATIRADVVVGTNQRAESVTLERGHSISGYCLRLGSPLLGAHVVARPSGSAGRPLLAVQGSEQGADLAWIGDRFEWMSVSNDSTDDGAFRLLGLASAEYSLVIDRLPALRATLPMPSSKHAILITAPAEDIDLELTSSLLTLDCVVPAGVRGQASLQTRSSGRNMTVLLDVEATSQLMVPPETLLSLFASIEGASPLQLELMTSGPGGELRRTLSFSPLEASSALDLEVVVDPPVAAMNLWLALHPASAPPESPLFTRRVEVVDGKARVGELTPGAYQLVAREGLDPFAPSFYPTWVSGIELWAGATTPQRLEFALGGQIRLDVRDPRGQRRPVRFRLLDSAQEEQSVEFETFLDGSRTRSPWYVTPWATNQLADPLEPGSYELQLWDDDVPERRFAVVVEAGRVSVLEVTVGD